MMWRSDPIGAGGAVEASSSNVRRAYHEPSLVVYGSVAKLTQGGGGSRNDTTAMHTTG